MVAVTMSIKNGEEGESVEISSKFREETTVIQVNNGNSYVNNDSDAEVGTFHS